MGTLNLIIKDRVIDQYFHDNKVFVEGRKGSDYTIEYYNNSPNRVKVVLSVDGLNVISGDNNWERGYVVDAWQTLKVPGWRKDNNNVAKFVFSSVRGSYNQHNDSGNVMNVGVIGAKVFNEKPYNWTWMPCVVNVNPAINGDPWHTGYNPRGYDTYTVNNLAGQSFGMAAGSMDCNYTATAAAPSAKASTIKASSSIGGTMRSKSAFVATPQNVATPAVEQGVGTGYGANQHFATREVSYEFNDWASETLTIYYDDVRGLRDRGINVRQPYRPEPNPFPTYSDGCPPPKYSRIGLSNKY